MRGLLLKISLFAIIAYAADAANILALCTVSSHSHAIYANVLVRALAARGHKLVVLSPDEERHKNPNITTIFLKGGYEFEFLHMNLEEIPATEGFVSVTQMLFDYGESQCLALLFSEENKRFYREYKNHKFDLVLMDVGVTECFLKYAHVFGNPPIVAFTAFFSIQAYHMGNFDNPAYVPHITSHLPDKMTFTQRMYNWLNYHYYSLARSFYLQRLDKISEEFFGFYEPTVRQLEDRIAINLVAEHFSISYPKPMIPATIPVSGLHIKPLKALPQDIGKFFSEAKHGVIFFSMGSNFQSKQLPDEKKQMFLKAFAQLPQRVLWKYEDDTMQNIPQNVLIRKWLPQSDILGQNNTALFISHNGYLSTQEAIYFGVPILGIPVIADQYKNSEKVIHKGLGLRLVLSEIKSSDQILHKIRTIINTPSYKENAERESKLYRDRPMTPLDTAVYWTEYVIRHKGAEHMRVASLDLAWYQYYLLDIYLAIGASIYAVYYCLVKLIRLVFYDAQKQKQS